VKLYGYWRSSAAYRVRIALGLKHIDVEQAFVHLRKGEQRAPEFLELNPMGLVPALIEGETVLTQSLAIIEYLDETHPAPPLLPKSPAERARVRALALAIACDIHPVDNLRVLVYLKREMKQEQAAIDDWYRHWVKMGFDGIEPMLAESKATGTFCHGDTPGLADICLVPQIANAQRLACDLAPYPTIMRIHAACQALPAFANAAPEKQGDAE
jgi:maleylpyruvate isomerase